MQTYEVPNYKGISGKFHSYLRTKGIPCKTTIKNKVTHFEITADEATMEMCDDELDRIYILSA